MNRTLRMTSLAATVAALTLTATPALAAPGPSTVTATTASPTPRQATASANILRPLTLEENQDLDLGTIALGTGTFSNVVVSISRDGATFNCDAALTCSGTHQPALYTVSGTNMRTVNVYYSPTVDMVSGSNHLSLAVNSPDTVALGASGSSGVQFGIGGSIKLSNTTPDGLYTGNFDVTVDY